MLNAPTSRQTSQIDLVKSDDKNSSNLDSIFPLRGRIETSLNYCRTVDFIDTVKRGVKRIARAYREHMIKE